YATAAFSDTPFAMGAGMGRGFDTFRFFQEGKCHRPIDPGRDYDVSDAYLPPHTPQRERNFYRHTMINREYAMETHGKACPELLFDAAIEWLDEHHSEPFFLWIDSFEPHEPWCPEEPYRSLYAHAYADRYIPFPVGPSSDWMTEADIDHVLALYKGDITHTDEMVGKVTAKLAELGRADDTIAVILSDHGEPFGEHGVIRKYNCVVYDELALMVWVMSAPGLVEPSTRLGGLVQNVDFAPTLLDLLGIEMPARPRPGAWMDYEPDTQADFCGVSAANALRGEAETVRQRAYLGAFGLRGAIRTERWKLIDNHGEKPNELFDMLADPAERTNLFEQEATLARDLHRRLWDFRRIWSGALAWRDKPAQQ
ncbi:MAG: sulfatase-like hydrolase/transferase, partial [Candidatus Brocadiae bacterium]|nr:sulfatase-like hydrolase/transferase [Candidatus Brocadiia bacterium]